MEAARRYAPERGSVQDYMSVLATLGIGRCVLVQPSFYGTDNGCQLDAMREIGPDRCRGVAVVAEDIAAGELQRLHELGMRGVRFNLMSGGLTRDALETVARKIAPFGWHVQIFAPASAIAELAPRLRALPVAVAIDHMGCPAKGGGVAHPDFPAARRLGGDRSAWGTRAGAARRSAQASGFDDGVPYAQALLAAAPDRVVWGLDWPPSRYYATPPAPGDWVTLLRKYTSEAAALRAILVDNPAALYDFSRD